MPGLRRWIAATWIPAAVAALVLSLRAIPIVNVPLRQLDESLYDSLYQMRPVENRQGGPVVIVAVDDNSINAIQKAFDTGWTWPRKYWGSLAEYLIEDCHARAVVFDLLFNTRSRPEKPGEDDDQLFAAAIDRARSTGPGALVFASQANPDGSQSPFFPPVKTPPLKGFVNVSESGRWRSYIPSQYGLPSLAVAAVKSAGFTPKLPSDHPFLLHFYGPHKTTDGRQTFRYVAAGNAILASFDPDSAKKLDADPAMFRDKIVLVGGIAAATFDLKQTPFGDQYPGVEIQATAIENLLNGDQVRLVSFLPRALFTLACSWLAAIGVIFPRRAWAKLLGFAGVIAALLGFVAMLFFRHDIIYMQLAAPLVAGVLTTILAFAWTYFGEDRQRRRLLKALSSVVSPTIAEELARDPKKLSIGGQRRDMTVMFTDIAGFTDLSETLPPEKLAPLLNFYLEEMSGIVLSQSGTLDKYIGDAIMSFWNAPLPQPDHAVLACRAALGIVRREAEIQPDLRDRGAKKLMTRLGINSGPMAVGFTGSSHLINYTVLGDSVNLGSRLEGANKLYTTRIMISQSTANLVKDRFVLRQLDVLRVKGKLEPMPVYELIAEGKPDAQTQRRIERYEESLTLYRAQKWDDAERLLVAQNREFPEDGPTSALLARIAHYRQDPPPADWDGVYVAKDK